VWIGTYKPTKQKVAIKRVNNKTEKDKRSNLAEIAYLAKLAHPNVVALIGVLSEPKTQQVHFFFSCITYVQLYILLEYMEAGTITLLTKKEMPGPYVAHVTKEILTALSFMHFQLIGHCDLKPANGNYLPFCHLHLQ
jgi:serine/threonine protein kinase